MSIDYYNKNAEAFAAGTLTVDMSALYAEFVHQLPEGTHILDAGCGSGRDTAAFQRMGFRVTGLPRLC